MLEWRVYSKFCDLWCTCQVQRSLIAVFQCIWACGEPNHWNMIIIWIDQKDGNAFWGCNSLFSDSKGMRISTFCFFLVRSIFPSKTYYFSSMKDLKCNYGRLIDNSGTSHFSTKIRTKKRLCLILQIKLKLRWSKEFLCAIHDSHHLFNICVIAKKMLTIID